MNTYVLKKRTRAALSFIGLVVIGVNMYLTAYNLRTFDFQQVFCSNVRYWDK